MKYTIENIKNRHGVDIKYILDRAKKLELTDEVPSYVVAETPSEEIQVLEEVLEIEIRTKIAHGAAEYVSFSTEPQERSDAIRRQGSLVVMRTEDYEEMLRVFGEFCDLIAPMRGKESQR